MKIKIENEFYSKMIIVIIVLVSLSLGIISGLIFISIIS